MKRGFLATLLLAGLVGFALTSSAATKVWNAGNGDWFTGANWSPLGAPGAGDDVLVTNAGARVSLTNAASIASLTLSNATIVCSNWLTSISASNDVVLRSGGRITLPRAFTNNVMSNRVWIACRNFTLDAGSTVDVRSLGYDGGYDSGGHGPGGGVAVGGVNEGCGAGHGGTGGSSGQGSPGGTYGSAYVPVAPGSGGASGNNPPVIGTGWRGGPGGGAIFVDARGLITAGGSILANGAVGPSRGGGGSGGSIYLRCGSFAAGVTGRLAADGGNSPATYDGGGGGGRIAVWRSIAGQGLTATVTPGSGGNPLATTGTVVWGFLPDPALVLTNGLGDASRVVTLQAPDTVATAVLTLRDAGESTNSMVWSVAGAGSWLSLSSAGGVLATGSQVSLIISNDSAGQGEGTYEQTLTFTASNVTMQGGVAPIVRTLAVRMEVAATPPPLIASITSSSSDGTYTNGDTINVTVNFSEAVTLVGGTLDVTLDTGRTLSIGAFEAASSASVAYVVSNGDCTMDLDATSVSLGGGGVLTNAEGVVALVALPATTIADGSAIVVNPLVPVLSAGASPISQNPVAVAVTFPCDVVGLAGSDFLVSGGTILGVSGGGSSYVASIAPSGHGTITLSLPASKVVSLQGVVNLASATLSRDFAYSLAVTVWPAGAGDVAGTNLWYNLVVTNTPVPATGYHFLQWRGISVPAGHAVDDPLVLTMDQARVVQAVFVTNGPAMTRTWSGSGEWFSPSNWSPAGLPDRQDTVVVRGGTNLVVDPIHVAALIVSNGTLVASNWNTAIHATTVTVQTNGVLTVPGAFPNNAMSNRVWIVCRDLTVDAGGAIDVAGRGFQGGRSPDGGSVRGSGTGAGAGNTGGGGCGGGSYGGGGGPGNGLSARAPTYGVTNAPTDPGSGGGAGVYGNAVAGSGGSAVRIEASGSVTLNGLITANGTKDPEAAGWRSGAGSGGSIYITCRRLLGASGAVTATGADTWGEGGGGGGGRVALWRAYNSFLFVPAVTGGVCGWISSASYNGQTGTVVRGYVPDPLVQPTTQYGRGFSLATLVETGSATNQTVSLRDGGESTNAMHWVMSPVESWISVVPSSGTVAAGGTSSVTFTTSAGALTAGTYTGTVTLVASNATMLSVAPVARTVTLVMTVADVLPPVVESIASTTPDGNYITGQGISVTVNFSEPVTLSSGTLEVPLNCGGTLSIAPFGPAASASGTYVVQASDSSPALDATDVLASGGAPTNAAGRAAFVALPMVNLSAGSIISVNGMDLQLSSAAADPTDLTTIPVTATFGHSVDDFVVGDVTVTNGTISGFSGSGQNYSFSVTPLARGPVTVAVAANVAHDAQASGNPAASLARFYAYRLSVAANPPGAGTISGTDTWYNLVVTNLATANAGYHFVQWSGTVPAGRHTLNPLEVTMDRPRTLLANFAPDGAAALRVWNGNGPWLTAANWSGGALPDVDEPVVIGSGTCLLADPTRVVSLLVSNGATLMFTNWNSILTVDGSVNVQSNGVITQAGPVRDGEMTNNIYIVCAGLAVDAGGRITADSRGWMGGTNTAQLGNGTGYGGADPAGHEAAGGSYGGYGARWKVWPPNGATYGVASNPVPPGSGGGAGNLLAGSGGDGGGAIRIEASGPIRVWGSITADGGSAPSRKGGGSGGSVLLRCSRLDGDVSGWVRAAGGHGGGGAGGASGGGGGGRIAVYSVIPGSNPVFVAVSMSVTNGVGGIYDAGHGLPEPGTIYWGQLPPPPKGSMFIIR